MPRVTGIRAYAEGSIEREGLRLNYLDWAPEGGHEAGPPMLFVHGLSSNARFWERLARRFPDRRVLALDQRAHGRSDIPAAAGAYDTDRLVADLVALLDHAEIDRALVAGHSWGGSVALEFAVTEAGRTRALALVDSPIQPISERMSWEAAATLMQPPLPRYASLDEACAATAELLGAAWDGDLREFVAHGLRPDGDALVLTLTADARLAILRRLHAFQPQLLLPAVEAPLLVALAGADSMLRSWKEAGARLAREARPDADVRWFDSAHDIPLIRADELAEAVRELDAAAA